MAGDLSDVLRKVVEGLHPDLRSFFRPSLLGRVEAVDTELYRVDVIVGGDGTDANPGLALPKVPVSSLFAQDGYGIWALPEVGAEVTVGFHDGDVTQPYVESPIYYRNQSPSGFPTGTIAIVGKAGQKLEFKPSTNEIVLSAGSVKQVTTDTRQEASTGDERRRIVGNRSSDVDGREEVTANEWRVTVNRGARIVAGSLEETIAGEASLSTGGSRNERIGGSVNRNVAGGVNDAVTFSKREVIGGAYQILVAATPGIAAPPPQPAYNVIVNLGNIDFDPVGGTLNLGANPLLPPILVNVGSPTSGPVQLGGAGAIGQAAAVGPILLSILTALIGSLKTSLQVGNLGAPTAPNPAFLALLAPIEAQLATLLSTKVFIAPA